jgi:subtilisin family serine protease
MMVSAGTPSNGGAPIGLSSRALAKMDEPLREAASLLYSGHSYLEGKGPQLPVILSFRRLGVAALRLSNSDKAWRSFVEEAADQLKRRVRQVSTKVETYGSIGPMTLMPMFSAMSAPTDIRALERLLEVDELDIVRAELDVAGWFETASTQPSTLRKYINVDRQGYDGGEQIVAIIDGQVNAAHPALVGRVISKADYSKITGNVPLSSLQMHATPIAGVIAGDWQNVEKGFHYQGVAPKAHIWHYCIAPMPPPNLESMKSNTLSALDKAIIHGAKIVNMSIGFPIQPQPNILTDAVDDAFNKDVLVIKSAGNAGPTRGSITAPGDAEYAVTVGSVDGKWGGRYVHDKSSLGPVNQRSGPDLVAPGSQQVVIDVAGVDVHQGRAREPATSYASAFVSGVAALLRQARPRASASALRDALLASTGQIYDYRTSRLERSVDVASALTALLAAVP